MARPIVDKLVNERAEELSFNRVYIDSIPKYMGNVNDTLEKVRLDALGISLNKVNILTNLKTLFEQIPAEGDPVLVFDKGNGNVTEYPTTKTNIRLLKALLIHQVNENEKYSEAVLALMYSFMRQIAAGAKEYKFEYEDERLTKMQRVVYKEMGDFIIETVKAAG